ncbi:MAG: YtxH domain-containing protein [Lutibacter sp.]|nr:YtxH domain-containing protein [Lutibacter sp.]
MGTGKILLGVLAGVATGATLGILFAPAKGSKTRKKIIEKGDNYANEFKAKLSEIVDSVKEKYENLKVETATVVEDTKSSAKEKR